MTDKKGTPMNTISSLPVALIVLLLGVSSLALSRRHDSTKMPPEPTLSETEQQALQLLKEDDIVLQERIEGCSRSPGFQTPGEPVYHKVTCRFDGETTFEFKEVDGQLITILGAEAHL